MEHADIILKAAVGILSSNVGQAMVGVTAAVAVLGVVLEST